MENQRVRLTKKLLKEALVDILRETPFNKVTISEICARAEINRTTFYKHYADETALYYEMESDMLKLLSENLGAGRDGQSSLTRLLCILRENRKVAAVMLNSDIDKDLSEKIFSLPEIVSQIKDRAKGNCPRFEELFFFICHGGYELVRHWVNEGCVTPPEEISELFSYITEKLIG
ncbi:MAG: TetR family transcriptional regulator C-terminal domain-containing protein [Clostridia bacterium]|nr:TetR family transcriptional regulator C-terminal domain-containing protein [Clostridia bacterium]